MRAVKQSNEPKETNKLRGVSELGDSSFWFQDYEQSLLHCIELIRSTVFINASWFVGQTVLTHLWRFSWCNNKPEWNELTWPITALCAKPVVSQDLIVYLVLWAEFNEKTGLLVPHEHESRLNRHHHVKTHLADLSREHLAAALRDTELLIFK